jgi:hypothetical protein
MDGFPERYEILPKPIENLLERAKRLGRFLAPQSTELCLSEYHRTAPDSVQPELPFSTQDQEKARRVAHYISMAEEANENRG